MGPRLQERGVPNEYLHPPEGFDRLQWGRAYKSAEFGPSMVDVCGRQGASMGPRLQERGVEFTLRKETRERMSFNGAALTRARSCHAVRLRRPPPP